MIGGVVGLAIVGLAIALGVVLSSSSSTNAANVSKVAATMRAAGCTFQTVPSQPYPKSGNLHIQSLSDKVRYNTYPPSSGYHYPTPAVWNDYTQAVNPKQAVHNLEHGAVVVWYGSGISPANRRKLDEFYNESPNGMLVTPMDDAAAGITYPKHERLGSKIALTAWVAPRGSGQGVVAICPNVDLKAFAAFRDAFRGKGPESYLIPTSSETPGT